MDAHTLITFPTVLPGDHWNFARKSHSRLVKPQHSCYSKSSSNGKTDDGVLNSGLANKIVRNTWNWNLLVPGVKLFRDGDPNIPCAVNQHESTINQQCQARYCWPNTLGLKLPRILVHRGTSSICGGHCRLHCAGHTFGTPKRPPFHQPAAVLGQPQPLLYSNHSSSHIRW